MSQEFKTYLETVKTISKKSRTQSNGFLIFCSTAKKNSINDNVDGLPFQVLDSDSVTNGLQGPKEKAAFQMVLKRRPHRLTVAFVSVQKFGQIAAVITS